MSVMQFVYLFSAHTPGVLLTFGSHDLCWYQYGCAIICLGSCLQSLGNIARSIFTGSHDNYILNLEASTVFVTAVPSVINVPNALHPFQYFLFPFSPALSSSSCISHCDLHFPGDSRYWVFLMLLLDIFTSLEKCLFKSFSFY